MPATTSGGSNLRGTRGPPLCGPGPGEARPGRAGQGSEGLSASFILLDSTASDPAGHLVSQTPCPCPATPSESKRTNLSAPRRRSPPPLTAPNTARTNSNYIPPHVSTTDNPQASERPCSIFSLVVFFLYRLPLRSLFLRPQEDNGENRTTKLATSTVTGAPLHHCQRFASRQRQIFFSSSLANFFSPARTSASPAVRELFHKVSLRPHLARRRPLCCFFGPVQGPALLPT